MSATMPEPAVQACRVAKETYLIRQLSADGPVLNSLVIGGEEPVVVDTGNARGRSAWLDEVWGIVEPARVRWVFLSRDDPDHAGNLEAVLASCPEATLVGARGSSRLAGASRYRAIEDGEALRLPDRTLTALRPPVADAGTTLGLFDHSTGVYWSVCTFAFPAPPGVQDAADVPTEEWRAAVRAWAAGGALDGRLEHLSSFGIGTLASAHAPPIYGSMVREAFDLLRGAAGQNVQAGAASGA